MGVGVAAVTGRVDTSGWEAALRSWVAAVAACRTVRKSGGGPLTLLMGSPRSSAEAAHSRTDAGAAHIAGAPAGVVVRSCSMSAETLQQVLAGTPAVDIEAGAVASPAVVAACTAAASIAGLERVRKGMNGQNQSAACVDRYRIAGKLD